MELREGGYATITLDSHTDISGKEVEHCSTSAFNIWTGYQRYHAPVRRAGDAVRFDPAAMVEGHPYRVNFQGRELALIKQPDGSVGIYVVED